jgi:hypothetical protein
VVEANLRINFVDQFNNPLVCVVNGSLRFQNGSNDFYQYYTDESLRHIAGGISVDAGFATMSADITVDYLGDIKTDVRSITATIEDMTDISNLIFTVVVYPPQAITPGPDTGATNVRASLNRLTWVIP